MNDDFEEDELMYRQIHPSFMDDGEPSSQPYAPTPKDEGKLSVDRSSLTTAEQSYKVFTHNGSSSACVYGLSVDEFKAQIIRVYSDPLSETADKIANPAHCYADYKPHSKNQHKNIAKRLKLSAARRGCLYKP